MTREELNSLEKLYSKFTEECTRDPQAILGDSRNSRQFYQEHGFWISVQQKKTVFPYWL